MTMSLQNLHFRPLTEGEEKPYSLLLLADPSKAIVDAYLKSSHIFIADLHNEVVGAIVLQAQEEGIIEIKNVAVMPALQGQGIGLYLLKNAVLSARKMNFNTIQIGTANSSIGQLYLYQKAGFEITAVKKNFFTDNYPEPIYENGLQARHLIMLSQAL
jgi:ribosomal protein S18 acetylase RimI-like enzyme